MTFNIMLNFSFRFEGNNNYLTAIATKCFKTFINSNFNVYVAFGWAPVIGKTLSLDHTNYERLLSLKLDHTGNNNYLMSYTSFCHFMLECHTAIYISNKCVWWWCDMLNMTLTHIFCPNNKLSSFFYPHYNHLPLLPLYVVLHNEDLID
jgi:hypothetical protein